MANKSMLFGANEATFLNTPIDVIGNNLRFGVGLYDESKVIGIATAEEADAKLRFVYDGPGNSGLIFVGNKLASSKVLDVTPVTSPLKVFNPSTGELEDSATESVVNKLKVTWFGTAEDPADGETKTQTWVTEVELLDRLSVVEMLAQVQHVFNDKLDEFKMEFREDSSALDASVNGIEDFISSDVVTEAENGAMTVTPIADENGYKSYKVGVKVDNDTVKVVNDKLAVATYTIDKLNEGEEGYSDQWSALYRLLMTAPGSDTPVQVGETINILKDFLVKAAHVCTFKYADEQKTAIDEALIGTEVVADNLPWALTSKGIWEQAVMGQGIKYGSTYLHLVINTRPEEEDVTDDGISDVYIDFTEIFKTFNGDGEFITVSDGGVISLDADAVTEYVDSSLGITDKFAELDATDASINERIDEVIEDTNEHFDTLDNAVEDLNDSLDVVEASYLKNITLEAPKTTNEQFHEVKVTQRINGTETIVSVDVANAVFYEALNVALNTLQSNDNYLSNLLSWENLD